MIYLFIFYKHRSLKQHFYRGILYFVRKSCRLSSGFNPTWFWVRASCTACAVGSTCPGCRTSLSSQLSRPFRPSWTLTDWATAVCSCSARSDTDAEREPNLFSKPSETKEEAKTNKHEYFFFIDYYSNSQSETEYPILEQRSVVKIKIQ